MPRRSAEETRREILAAARHCFAEMGIQNSSMDEVAKKAGVTKPTIYAHFDSKDALRKVISNEVINQFHVQNYRDFDPTKPLEEQLSSFLKEYIAIAFEPGNFDLFRALIVFGMNSARDDTIERARQVHDTQLSQWLGGVCDSGMIVGIEPTEAYDMIWGMIRGIIFWPVVLERAEISQEKAHEMIDKMVYLFLDAYATQDAFAAPNLR